MTSTRCMPWEWSSSVITLSAMAGDVKLGQPVPESNFVSDANSGAPLVHDEERGLYAIGPSTVSGRALATAEAPELELPDLNGNPFKLSSLRGQKVLLVAWASW